MSGTIANLPLPGSSSVAPVASVSAFATQSAALAGVRVGMRPNADSDAPASIEMREIDDQDGPYEVHMAEIDGKKVPMALQLEGKNGGVRKLKFTKEQWEVLEKEFKKLAADFPGAEITFDVEQQKLTVRADGKENTYLVDNSWPGASEFIQALIDYKSKEIRPERYREYDPQMKGNVKAKKALVSPDRMTDRLKRVSADGKDWAGFTKTDPGIIKAKALHKALKDSINEEMTQLQTELDKQKQSREPAAQSHISYLTTNLEKLRRLQGEIDKLDTFAAGWAIANPINTAGLSGDQILAAARQKQDQLQAFIVQKVQGNPLTSSHDNYAFKGIRNALGEVVKDLQPVEVEYARDIVAMNLGGAQVHKEDRMLYEAFVGEAHIKSDSIEESLLVRYARDKVSIDAIRGVDPLQPSPIPSTGIEALDQAIRTRVADKLVALQSKPQPSPTPSPQPPPPGGSAAGQNPVPNGSLQSSGALASTAVAVPGSAIGSVRPTLVPPPLPSGAGAGSSPLPRPVTSSSGAAAANAASSVRASSPLAQPPGSAGRLVSPPPPRSRDPLHYDPSEFASAGDSSDVESLAGDSDDDVFEDADETPQSSVRSDIPPPAPPIPRAVPTPPQPGLVRSLWNGARDVANSFW